MEHVIKYRLPLMAASTAVAVQMPVGAKIVHVHEQQDNPTLWVQADSSVDAPFETRWFAVLPTGDSFDETRHSYLGTVHIDWTVWHIFEVFNLDGAP